jgi:hypothetical protein
LVTASILRWAASSVLLALLVLEHLRLARRATPRWPLFVPGAPVLLAFRRGERWAPALSLVLLSLWLALRATA